MLYREWNLRTADEKIVEMLCKELEVSRLLASVLASRCLDDPQKARALLYPSGTLPDPFSIKDMEKAVERIHQAIDAGERIAIFGDYDVDGITATALLYTYIAEQDADVWYKLPSRSDDGYSITADLVDTFDQKGVQLIITVDGGSSALDGIARAKELGIDMIITDHHLPPRTELDVVAFVNPCRPDDSTELNLLSGVGVAFMLVCALAGCTPEDLIPEFGDFVALGTVADVMKLVGVNRTLVKSGLALLKESKRPGLCAIIESCGWAGKEIAAENISYGLAPRLNAAGRMGDATIALQLLLAESEEEARPLIESLQQHNLARQKIEQDILERIEKQLKADPSSQRARLLVVAGEGWHSGIIGIVASRLVEKYAKPVIVISIEDGEGKGSGRSIQGFSLYNAIASCGDMLLRYGGHDLAAGLSIKPQNIAKFRKKINRWAVENWQVGPLPEREADVLLKFEDLTVPNVRELDLLSPCGSGNPAPRFLLQNVTLDSVYPVSEGKHCRLRILHGQENLSAVLFGTGPDQLPYRSGDKLDLLVALSIYEGKADSYINARIIEMRPAGLGNAHAAEAAMFESFMLGRAATKEQRNAMCPVREEIATIYCAVRDGKRIFGADLRLMFSVLQDLSPSKIVAGMAVLEELGLVEINSQTERYTAPPVEKKKDLGSSEILQRLEA